MALDSSEVRVAVTGAVAVNATGSGAAPTDADSALGAGWVDLGYVSEDGVTETRDRSTNNIKAWQNAVIVRSVVTESTATFNFTLLQTNKDVVEQFYAAAVDTGDGSVVVDPGATGGRKEWAIDVIDGTDLIRIWIPQGELVEAPGDQTYNSSDPIGYQFTITAYPDTDLAGSYQKFYSSLAA